jgi:hypothetical protein
VSIVLQARLGASVFLVMGLAWVVAMPALAGRPRPRPQITIRTWVTVIEAESGGFVQLDPPEGAQRAVTRLQGGFYAVVRLDLIESLLPDLAAGLIPLEGTITIEDARIAGQTSAFGKLCTWANPEGVSAGTISINLLTGTATAELELDVLATTSLSANLPPAQLLQPVSFQVEGVTLDTLLAAQASGDTSGLFATSAPFEGDSEILGVPVHFSLDLQVTNGPKPSVFSPDHLAFCNPFFEQQGEELFHGLNAKSSYLQAAPLDAPKQPIVISLADLGAVPGDTLRLARVGTYSDILSLLDGVNTPLTGIFSATGFVGSPFIRNRVVGAIDAGPDVTTGFLSCIVPLVCDLISTDVSQDFPIGSSLDVVVPTGAAYLIVAPLPPSYLWSDNSGFGFGVNVSVNPTP